MTFNRGEIGRALAAIFSALAVAVASGCYRHVVSERGLGRDPDRVYEPNVQEGGSSVDRFMWGDETADTPD